MQGIDWEILSLVLFFFLILINLFPLDYAYLIIFFFLMGGQGNCQVGFKIDKIGK